MKNSLSFVKIGFGVLMEQGIRSLPGLLLVLIIGSSAVASDFQIQPTSLTLTGTEKSGVFSVINSGSEKIDFQVSVKEWSQDANGKDVYQDTQEIVFFPKIMTVEANEQRAIRIGAKAPPSLQEKTYRLFVEEIPTAKNSQELKTGGKIHAGLTIAFRFATPIFVTPVSPKLGAAIEKMEMSKGTVKALVKNTGNLHIKLFKLVFLGKASDGKELFSKEVAGWYVLHGLSVPYEVIVPKEVCGNLATVELKAQSENININGSLNVQKSMCAQ